MLTPSWDPRPGHLWVRWTCPAGHVTESVYLILEWRFQFWVPKTHVDMFKVSWGRAKQMMTAGQ